MFSEATFLKYSTLQLQTESKCQRCRHTPFILALERQGWWVYEFEPRQGYMAGPFLCLPTHHHYKSQQQQQKPDIKKIIPLKVVTYVQKNKKDTKPRIKNS